MAKAKKKKALEVPVLKIEHDAETIESFTNQPKIDVFEKKWYEKKKKQKDITIQEGPSYAEQVSQIRYVRKRKKKKH